MKSREIKKFREDYTDYTKKCVFEGYKLAVLFDEKDDVKRMGGRWDANEQTWWMPRENLKKDAEQYGGPPNGSLVEDYLNDLQMVMGQYGEFQKKDAQLNSNHASEYKLKHTHSENRVTVLWWDAEDAVCFHQSQQDGTFGNDCPDAVWYTVENARIRWGHLIDDAYIRV